MNNCCRSRTASFLTHFPRMFVRCEVVNLWSSIGNNFIDEMIAVCFWCTSFRFHNFNEISISQWRLTYHKQTQWKLINQRKIYDLRMSFLGMCFCILCIHILYIINVLFEILWTRSTTAPSRFIAFLTYSLKNI